MNSIVSTDFMSADTGLKTAMYTLIGSVFNRYEPINHPQRFYQKATLLKMLKSLFTTNNGHWTLMSLLGDWLDVSTTMVDDSPSMVQDCHINDVIVEMLKGLKESYVVPPRHGDFPKERYFPPTQDRINLHSQKFQ